MMFHVGDVIRKLRRERKLSVVQLGDLAGVDKGTVSAIERGENFRVQTLEALAAALGTTAGELFRHLSAAVGIQRAAHEMARQSANADVLDVDVSGYARDDIPVIQEGEASPAGLTWDPDTRSAREIEEFTSRPFDYREKGAYAVVLRGDSMEPLLKRGMRLIVSPNVKPNNGDLVYVQLKSGERLAKIAARQPAGWLLSSANPAYAPRVVSDDEIEHIHKVAYVRFLK